MNNRQQTINNKQRKLRGFSLVETLVAVAILATAVVAALSVAASGISSSILSKDQVIAFYLAQEGIEEIRNLRDENGLKGLPWLTGITDNSSDPCYFGNDCYVDTLSATPLTRCAGDCPILKKDPDTGFYGYDINWTDTVFKRTVQLTSINSQEISILVIVDWSKGTINRQFRARENILDWQ